MIPDIADFDDTSGTRIARVILEHAARISGEQDISAMVGLHAALARDLVGANRSSVWLIDEPHEQLWTRVADGINEIRIPLTAGLVGACIAGDQVIIANDLKNDPRFHRSIDQTSGYQTECVLCVPLRAGHKTIGALQVLNKPDGFTKQDAELLNLMAVYTAAAIQTERLRQDAEEARLLRRELDLARDVQLKLLPRSFPPVPGIEYTGFCRSARFVGGDYYDLLPLGNGAFAFTLGDVSGKGIPAAVLMASIHTLLRSLLMRNSENIAELVGELNQATLLTSSDDRYSTLFCAVVNPERTRMRYVNAGHLPPYILRGDGTIESPHGGNIPIGMLKNTRYTERTVDLSPDDLILCVSDGITEARNGKFEFWDEATIHQVLRSNHARPLDSLTGELVSAVDHWADGAEQHDDMTAVAVRIAAQ